MSRIYWAYYFRIKKPVHILQLGASVDEMVNMAAVAVVDAQEKIKVIGLILYI